MSTDVLIKDVTIGNMKFNDWLLENLKAQDWSQADLARHSGLTRSVISKYIMGRVPDDEALRKIAKAFNLPTEIVFRAAGLLPPISYSTEQDEKLKYIISELSADDKEDLYAIALAKLERKKREKK